MAANRIVQARTCESMKEQAVAELGAMGLAVSDTVRPMLTNMAHEKAFPVVPLTPNAVTGEATKASRKDNLPRFGGVQALHEDLHAGN